MAISSKQVMDMRPGKGFSAGQSNEHLRNWSDRAWKEATKNGNYDRTREKLNFEIIRGKIQAVDKTKSIPQRITELLRERGIKDPNEGLEEPKYRTINNLIFGGSRHRMYQLAFGNQHINFAPGADNSNISRQSDIEKWAMDVYRFVADKWGEENIAGFIVHLDETNPHVHCTLLPIQDGKFAYKKIFAGGSIYEFKDRMIKLHDEFAKVNEKWGLCRGTSIAITGNKHRSTEEYRRALTEECVTLEEQVETNRTLLKQLNAEVLHAEKRVKGLTTMIGNLEQSKTQLEDEMLALSAEIKAGQGDSIELQKQIDKLGLDYEKVLESLADKRQKLSEANRKLSEFREMEELSKEKMETYRQQAEEYRTSVRDASEDLAQQVQFRIADALISDVISQLKSTLPTLGDARNAFESTLIEDLAEYGNELLRCAGLLFAGYVDGATTFAEGHGGGGSDSSLPWGRKEDEDDLQWARRCLFHAARMMRPIGGKKVKRK